MRNMMPHASTTSCMNLSESIIFVGSPLFLSTTVICMYRSSPISTNSDVR